MSQPVSQPRACGNPGSIRLVPTCPNLSIDSETLWNKAKTFDPESFVATSFEKVGTVGTGWDTLENKGFLAVPTSVPTSLEKEVGTSRNQPAKMWELVARSSAPAEEATKTHAHAEIGCATEWPYLKTRLRPPQSFYCVRLLYFAHA
jgi:hypothetical protein